MRKIAFISDIHFDEQFPIDCGIDAKKNWNRIITDLKSKKINEIIFGGDIGAQTGHQYFTQTLKDFSVKFILGNHDAFTQVSKFYNPYNRTDELYYSFDDNYNKYLFLDSSSAKLSEKQLDWIKENIKAEKPLIVFIHHPVIEVKTAIDKMYPLLNRDIIKSLFESIKQPVTLFCGHYHMNDELHENNIRQIITQSSSYQIEKETNELSINNTEFGYRIIEIEKNNIKTELVTFKNQNKVVQTQNKWYSASVFQRLIKLRLA